MKKCANCGADVKDDALWCPECGADVGVAGSDQQQPGWQPTPQPAVEPVVQQQPAVEQEERPRPRRRPLIIPREEQNTLGLVSFILTMVGMFGFLFTSWLGFGLLLIFLFPVTLIMSFIAMFKKPRGFAIAAFIISLLECLSVLIVVIFFGALIGAMFS